MKNNENSSIFFRKGLIDQWKEHLTNDQIQLLRTKFKLTMKELNYIQ